MEVIFIVLIRKSLFIFIYYVTVATFSCLAFSSLIISYEKTGLLQDNLSINSIGVSIQSSNGPLAESVSTGTLIENLTSKTQEPFILYKDTGTPNGKEFYVFNQEFPIASTNNILHKDISIIYLNHSLEKNIIKENGKQYFFYKSKPYEVAGTFERVRKNINQDSAFFASLDMNANVTGVYYVDGVSLENMNQVLKTLRNEDSSLDINMFPMKQTLKDRISLVVEDQVIVIILIMVAFLLIGFNTIGTTSAWISSRNDEIYARYLVGGTFRKVQWWLLKEYWLILVVSFLVGLLISFLILKANIFNYLINEIDIYGVLLAFLFCFSLGTITGYISSLWDQRKKETIRKGDS